MQEQVLDVLESPLCVAVLRGMLDQAFVAMGDLAERTFAQAAKGDAKAALPLSRALPLLKKAGDGVLKGSAPARVVAAPPLQLQVSGNAVLAELIKCVFSRDDGNGAAVSPDLGGLAAALQ